MRSGGELILILPFARRSVGVGGSEKPATGDLRLVISISHTVCPTGGILRGWTLIEGMALPVRPTSGYTFCVRIIWIGE